jgi:hypothetical protein
MHGRLEAFFVVMFFVEKDVGASCQRGYQSGVTAISIKDEIFGAVLVGE